MPDFSLSKRIAQLRSARSGAAPAQDRHEGAPSVVESPKETAEAHNTNQGGDVEERATLRARRRALLDSVPLHDGDDGLRRANRDRLKRETNRAKRNDDLKRGEQDSVVLQLPPLPQQARKRSWGTIVSFVLCVVVPTVLASVYYFFIASSQYSVEFRFSVRDAKSTITPSQTSGISSIFGGTTQDTVDNYIVADFLTSRQAVGELMEKFDITKMYGRPEIDWLSRFDDSRPIERFMPYWQRMVTANYDQVTGIATAQVRAFSAEDAFTIAKALVSLSENLVNNIALRPLKDAIRFAEIDVERAENRLKSVRAALTNFRNTEQMIDPQTGVVTSNVALAQTLRASISQMETEYSALRKQKVSADGSLAAALTVRIKAAKEQLMQVESQVKEASSGSSSLAQVVGRYEQLDLERQFAQAMLQTALQNLEQARSSAITQHIYVSPFVDPALPQSATYPKRVVSVLIAAFSALLFWTLGLLVIRSMREHLT